MYLIKSSELGFDVDNTADYIARELEKLGLNVKKEAKNRFDCRS